MPMPDPRERDLAATQAAVDQMKSMVRDELRGLENSMGLEEGMATIWLVDRTTDIAETGEIPGRRGVRKLIGMLAFIGIAQLHQEHEEAAS